MKLCRDELLLLGGIYQVAALIVSLFTSGFVFQLNDRFPRISVFLASIGWIPYFAVLYALFSAAVDFMVSGSDSVTVFLNNYMPVYDVYMAAIILSLLYAAYKVFYKKEDLAMTCEPITR